jgi:hypothetical protein
MLIVWTGQSAPVPGVYCDDHGHRVLLQAGEQAPICSWTGAAVIRWHLLRPLPRPTPDR